MNRERGIGTLEMAMVLLMLMSTGIGVVALYDYLEKKMFVSHVVDEFIFDTSVKPLTIDPAGVIVAEQRMRDELPRMIEKISHNIAQQLESEDLPPNSYYIEADFAAIELDHSTGETLGLRRFQGSRVSAGNLQVSAQDLEQLSIDREFEKLRGPIGEPSAFAIPAGVLPGGSHYLPQRVLVGLRAYLDLKSSISGKLLSTLGISNAATVSDLKVTCLRGELD